MNKNNILTIVKRVLSESYGISDEVTKSANELSKLILKKGESKINTDSATISKNGDYKFTNEIFDYDFAGIQLKVGYEYCIVKDFESFKKLQRFVPNLGSALSGYDEDGRLFIQVMALYVNGRGLHPDYYGNIQHELEHIYQQIKKGGRFKVTKLRRKGLEGKGGVNGKRVKDTDLYVGCQVVYMIQSHEQDGFVNSLYGDLTHKNPKIDGNRIIKASSLFQNYITLKKEVKYLKNLLDKNDLEINNKFHSYFGVTLASLIKKGDIAIKKIKDKANRVIFKYYQETGERLNFI